MIASTMNSAVHSEDADLVTASLRGDREAFGRIVARYQSLVCSMAYSGTGSLSQSEDLAQESFLEAWKHLASLREPAKLRSWLCGIARNRIHQWLRSAGREPSYKAASLESVAESPCAEPAPGERAISREEEDILWRALERIPDTYRLPLVLFYRDQQSIESVAQSLEITEETARQRLSRGRKLLQEEVQAFVESALSRTTPGRTFTLGVVAALPLAATTAKAASGLAAAKGAAGAKGLVTLPLIGGLASMLGSVILSWKIAADEGQTERERKFLRRIGAVQVAAFVMCLAAASVAAFFSAKGWMWFTVAVFALVALAAAANSILVVPWMVRRQLELRAEDGAWTPPPSEAPQGTEHSMALRKALKQSLPLAVMMAGCAFFLPWKNNWFGCLGYMAIPALSVVWNVRRAYRQQRYPARVNSWWRLSFAKHPLFLGAAMAFLMCLLCVVLSNVGVRYLSWLNTGKLPYMPLFSSVTNQLLLGLGVAILVFAAVAMVATRALPALGGIGRKFRVPFLEQLQATAGGPLGILEKTYRPLFDQLNLDSEHIRQVKDLLLKRTMVGVRFGLPLANPALRREKRAALLQQVKADVDGVNASIRELLGDRFAVLREFEGSIADRMLLDEFGSKTADTELAMNKEQGERLLQALLAARRTYPWTSDLDLQNQSLAFSELYTQAGLETFIREQTEFDQRFLLQARELLSAEQLAMFEKLQAKRRNSQIGQFKLGLKLFGN